MTFTTASKIFRLTSDNTDLFIFTKTGSLMHFATKKCVKPRGHWNGAKLSLTADCSSPDTIFVFTYKNSLLHGLSGKCIHPYGGSSRPSENTRIVLWSGCNSGRLKFNPIYKNELSAGLGMSFTIPLLFCCVDNYQPGTQGSLQLHTQGLNKSCRLTP